MLDRVREQVAADLETAARGQRRHGTGEVEVLEGRDVAAAHGQASTGRRGELLICASSERGAVAAVLGDRYVRAARVRDDPNPSTLTPAPPHRRRPPTSPPHGRTLWPCSWRP